MFIIFGMISMKEKLKKKEVWERAEIFEIFSDIELVWE